jgi:hypothetical protein
LTATARGRYRPKAGKNERRRRDSNNREGCHSLTASVGPEYKTELFTHESFVRAGVDE